MDETTKVLIGTLSGFIIAFFAEPVKSYFQNRTRLRNLRTALYKEILINYIVLSAIIAEEEDYGDAFPYPEYVTRYSIKQESYKHAIEKELTLFYQLDEANAINLMQGLSIVQLTMLEKDFKGVFESQGNFTSVFRDFSERYQRQFEDALFSGRLKRNILRRLMNNDMYQKAIRKGKERSASKASRHPI